MFVSNVIHNVDLLIIILPFPIFNDRFTKRSVDALFCSCTRMLVFEVDFCTFRHKTDSLRHALSSSLGVVYNW